MATDRELRNLLRALLRGQTKLADGQKKQGANLLRHERLLVKLAVGQADLQDAIASLARSVEALADHQDSLCAGLDRLTQTVTTLAERQDRFTDAVMRGFTDAAERDSIHDRRLKELEKLIDRLGAS